MKRLLLTIVAIVAAGTLAFAEAAQKDEVTVQGKIGCSHCNFHIGNSCGVGLKTAAGKIYVVDNASAELKKDRFSGGQLTVTGTVTEKDGTAHIHASKTELKK